MLGLEGWGIPDGETSEMIFWKIRIPRSLFVFLAGAAICLSGYLFQLLVMNPLADTYILGTAGGVTIGANLCITGWLPVTLGGVYLLPIWGFVFGVVVTLLVISVSRYKNTKINATTLVLAGVAVSSFSVALSSLLIYFSEDANKIRSIVFWAFGSFNHISWNHIPVLLISVFGIAGFFQFQSKKMNLLVLGEQSAQDLGVNTKRLHWLIILAGSWLTGITISICGPIGFVGLIIPHFVRAFFGSIGARNVIFVCLLGGGALLLGDTVSRWLYPPVGLPIGIVTSIVGAPFFIYLVYKTSYRF